MPADLHIHSIYSDGSFTPSELVDMADDIGLGTLALSDHDTVKGITEMVDAGRKKGIEVIPAIEFSTMHGQREAHILGYYIDYYSGKFLSRIEEFYNRRLERAREMVHKLNNLGIEITYQEVEETAGDRYIGRPHIARTMKKNGYIENAEEAFSDDYIGSGGRAYVPRYNLNPLEAVKIIHQAGGLAVLAHPYLVNTGKHFDYDDIKSLSDHGLDGIEVFHSGHKRNTVDYYLNIASQLKLLITGGSDFHGSDSTINLGDVVLPDRYLLKLRNYHKRYLSQ